MSCPISLYRSTLRHVARATGGLLLGATASVTATVRAAPSPAAFRARTAKV